jgi:hypothetical protein
VLQADNEIVIRALVMMLLTSPFVIRGADAGLDQAIREAAKRAGLWQATLDQTRAQIFAPEQIRVILMNLHLLVFAEDKPVRTVIMSAEFFLQSADSTPAHILWLADYRVLNGNQLRLDARWWSGPDRDPPRVTVDAEYAPTDESITGIIKWQGKSVPVKFVRPSTRNLPFEGEWTTDESQLWGIFHIRSLGGGQYIAVLDQLQTQPHFGIVFTGGVEKGRLELHIQAPNAFNFFSATVEGDGKVLNGEWRGNGFLTDPADFHRVDAGWYAPSHAP